MQIISSDDDDILPEPLKNQDEEHVVPSNVLVCTYHKFILRFGVNLKYLKGLILFLLCFTNFIIYNGKFVLGI